MTNTRRTGERPAPAARGRQRHSLEETRTMLLEALERFADGRCEHLKNPAKLTQKNLAREAGVDSSVAFAHYRAPHARDGELRYPEVVARFKELAAGVGEADPQGKPLTTGGGNAAGGELARLRVEVNELRAQAQLYATRLLDADIQRVEELVRENAFLHQRVQELERKPELAGRLSPDHKLRVLPAPGARVA